MSQESFDIMNPLCLSRVMSKVRCNFFYEKCIKTSSKNLYYKAEFKDKIKIIVLWRISNQKN